MMTKNSTILCVDDETANLRLLEAALAPRGYGVIAVASGKAALEHLAAQQVDLILLDVMMPEMNGFEVCKRIKGEERYRNIPIVMVTALTSKEDRIRSIEAGADDFLSKPFDHTEVLARIRMLLNVRELNNRLARAYAAINDLTSFGEQSVKTFDPLHYDLSARFDALASHLLLRAGRSEDAPAMMLIGVSLEGRGREWRLYDSGNGSVKSERLDLGIGKCLVAEGMESCSEFYNTDQLGTAKIGHIIGKIKAMKGDVRNAVSFHSNDICIHAFNYGREVTSHDAAVLNSLVMQSLFLRSLAGQVKDTEKAFHYLVFALARAAEANDEDTGNHILRVGGYCAVIAKDLGMSEDFADIIRIQATLHDVGKIHIHPDVLKKPGKLTPEEYEQMKNHTIYGGRILGDHARLTLAKQVTLSHHERWDGSGYPYGLKGERIPPEGRIMNIADQYDALRNKRVYKPAFDHDATRRIITEGDGRTLPQHFDPRVLQAFKAAHRQLEEFYETHKG